MSTRTRKSIKDKGPAKTDSPKSAAQQMFQGQLSPKRRKKIHTLEQWVEIITENGQTTTTLYPSNKQLIEDGKRMWPTPDYVYRRLNFVGGIPDEYAWVGGSESMKQLGGCGIQRMTPDTWLEVIAREAPEVLVEGYKRALAPQGIGPTMVGNLPRPEERGGCECPVCLRNKRILDLREAEGLRPSEDN